MRHSFDSGFTQLFLGKIIKQSDAHGRFRPTGNHWARKPPRRVLLTRTDFSNVFLLRHWLFLKQKEKGGESAFSFRAPNWLNVEQNWNLIGRAAPPPPPAQAIPCPRQNLPPWAAEKEAFPVFEICSRPLEREKKKVSRLAQPEPEMKNASMTVIFLAQQPNEDDDEDLWRGCTAPVRTSNC